MRAKYLVQTAAVIGLLAAVTVNAATAAIVSIGAREDGVGAITLLAGPTLATASFTGVFGDYGIRASGDAPPILPSPGVLASNNLDVSTNLAGSHTLDLYVTAQNTTFAQLMTFISSFTLNSIIGTATTTMSTFLDTANGLFTTSGGTVTALGTAGPFAAGPVTEVDQANALCGASCSITALYHIATTGIASSNATIQVIAVPGPIVGAGLPALLAACGGLLALARRRRQQLS